MTADADPIISLDAGRVEITADPATRVLLRQRFATDHVLRLPRFFAGGLLTMVQRRLKQAPFETRIADRVFPPAIDLKLRDDTLHGLLQFVVNDARVIAFVRDITATPAATGFVGAVYRLAPGHGHSDSWHTDDDGNRLLGLSVNLSESTFAGGELEMRPRRGGLPLWRIGNTGPGDALLFRISPELEHHIKPMAGSTPKTAFAGWFCRDADLKL